MFTWAVCCRVSSWVLHVGMSLGHCAAELLRLIMEDDHLDSRSKKMIYKSIWALQVLCRLDHPNSYHEHLTKKRVNERTRLKRSVEAGLKPARGLLYLVFVPLAGHSNPPNHPSRHSSDLTGWDVLSHQSHFPRLWEAMGMKSSSLQACFDVTRLSQK